MIPEFVGRLPAVTTLDPLNERDLINILLKPKNALVKQYSKFLEMEGVKLTFTDDALIEIARQSLSKQTGARALRSIMEDVMLEVMYDLPSQTDISECVITPECVKRTAKPVLIKKTEELKKTA
jgi:ATP-dependent Clp protease ATP-binding subunit ClpX